MTLVNIIRTLFRRLGTHLLSSPTSCAVCRFPNPGCVSDAMQFFRGLKPSRHDHANNLLDPQHGLTANHGPSSGWLLAADAEPCLLSDSGHIRHGTVLKVADLVVPLVR
jgi:hypothetical protein